MQRNEQGEEINGREVKGVPIRRGAIIIDLEGVLLNYAVPEPDITSKIPCNCAELLTISNCAYLFGDATATIWHAEAVISRRIKHTGGE